MRGGGAAGGGGEGSVCVCVCVGGGSKVMFKKISQNIVKSPLETDFSPQLMACIPW